VRAPTTVKETKCPLLCPHPRAHVVKGSSRNSLFLYQNFHRAPRLKIFVRYCITVQELKLHQHAVNDFAAAIKSPPRPATRRLPSHTLTHTHTYTYTYTYTYTRTHTHAHTRTHTRATHWRERAQAARGRFASQYPDSYIYRGQSYLRLKQVAPLPFDNRLPAGELRSWDFEN
jgi:hypothetical protein